MWVRDQVIQSVQVGVKLSDDNEQLLWHMNFYDWAHIKIIYALFLQSCFIWKQRKHKHDILSALIFFSSAVNHHHWGTSSSIFSDQLPAPKGFESIAKIASSIKSHLVKIKIKQFSPSNHHKTDLTMSRSTMNFKLGSSEKSFMISHRERQVWMDSWNVSCSVIILSCTHLAK